MGLHGWRGCLSFWNPKIKIFGTAGTPWVVCVSFFLESQNQDIPDGWDSKGGVGVFLFIISKLGYSGRLGLHGWAALSFQNPKIKIFRTAGTPWVGWMSFCSESQNHDIPNGWDSMGGEGVFSSRIPKSGYSRKTHLCLVFVRMSNSI